MGIRFSPSAVTAAVVCALTCASAPLAAQYLGGGDKTAHEARLADLDDMRGKFVALGRAFPTDRYDWRPMEGVRSVRDVLALVAAEAALFPTMWGFEAPAWVPESEIGAELARLRALTPEELVDELDRGFRRAIDLFGQLDEDRQARPVGFFGLTVPLGTAITLMANDMHEHLGQLIAYARTNLIVPPWSR